ncbi:IQ domain-containing protein C isoform X1 [Calypte anna]|uniref:IQ domain-containing protein C isoform X1 n=1 Tax=Calypte anna TaxID=9244 RepID=UPI0011C439EB|nr:IQ domain-containing protein C isoform X1 [Calypte anna]
MAAALGLQAEGWERLLRAVTRLQACVRGYLLRKRFGTLRAEYEEVVREIEGDLSRLEWRGRLLPRPFFHPEIPSPGERLGPHETAPSNNTSAENPQEVELDTSEPEQDCSSGNPATQLQSKEELNMAGDSDGTNPTNLGGGDHQHTKKGCSAPSESEDWQNDSIVSSAWDSALLGAESLEASLGIPLEDLKQLPHTRSGLQSYRNHLMMELLWLQQAIISRKNFLMLKQKLGTPDPWEGIPEHQGHLDWCGAAAPQS